MNTILKTASMSTILAIDLAKYKSVACLFDQDTRAADASAGKETAATHALEGCEKWPMFRQHLRRIGPLTVHTEITGHGRMTRHHLCRVERPSSPRLGNHEKVEPSSAASETSGLPVSRSPRRSRLRKSHRLPRFLHFKVGSEGFEPSSHRLKGEYAAIAPRPFGNDERGMMNEERNFPFIVPHSSFFIHHSLFSNSP